MTDTNEELKEQLKIVIEQNRIMMEHIKKTKMIFNEKIELLMDEVKKNRATMKKNKIKFDEKLELVMNMITTQHGNGQIINGEIHGPVIINSKTGMNNRNFLNMMFSTAPALLIEIKKMCNDTNKLMGDLLKSQKENSLHTLIGSYIKKEYLKEDPKQQSLWCLDTSRNKFVYREDFDNKPSEWNPDEKGVHIINNIITPLIKNIKKKIGDADHTDFEDKFLNLIKSCEKETLIPKIIKDLRIPFHLTDKIKNTYIGRTKDTNNNSKKNVKKKKICKSDESSDDDIDSKKNVKKKKICESDESSDDDIDSKKNIKKKLYESDESSDDDVDSKKHVGESDESSDE